MDDEMDPRSLDIDSSCGPDEPPAPPPEPARAEELVCPLCQHGEPCGFEPPAAPQAGRTVQLVDGGRAAPPHYDFNDDAAPQAGVIAPGPDVVGQVDCACCLSLDDYGPCACPCHARIAKLEARLARPSTHSDDH